VKEYHNKVLLGCIFTKPVVIALGIGLICSVGVEAIIDLFSQVLNLNNREQ
jgi:hypothetical protein